MNTAYFNRKLETARKSLLTGKIPQALGQFERLVHRYPGYAGPWIEYGEAAAKAGQFDLADAAWTKAQVLKPEDDEIALQIGHLYNGYREPDKARACFERAASLSPKSINPRVSLALLMEEQHLLDAARSAVEQCLALNHRDEQARYVSALLDRRAGKLDDAERELRSLLAREPAQEYVRYAARHELAEVLDRTGRFNEAMSVLAEAKCIMRTLLPKGEGLDKGYDRMVKASHADLLHGKDVLSSGLKSFPPPSRELVPPLAFLGGHPRSGTTLLEQILDAHPEICALDETNVFGTRVAPAFREQPKHSPQHLNSLRRTYVRGLSRYLATDAAGKVIVDKNPSPTAQLPIWLRVFPELRVIIALRDPRDVLISCYFQNLRLNPVSVKFLSLDGIAQHYSDLMTVWLAVRQWEGFSWIETRYEDTVADLKKEGQRVTEFLRLSWSNEQAHFYEKSSKKKLYAPTYHDVTQPIYTKSVGRWRDYEKHIAPVLPILKPYCEAFGYD